MVNPPAINMSSHVQTVSSFNSELDKGLSYVDIPEGTCATEKHISEERLEWRKRQLKSLCDANPGLSQEERAQLLEVLSVHHSVFLLEDGE